MGGLGFLASSKPLHGGHLHPQGPPGRTTLLESLLLSPPPALTVLRPARAHGPLSHPVWPESSPEASGCVSSCPTCLGAESPDVAEAKTRGFGLCSLQWPSSQCPRPQTTLPDAGQLLPGKGMPHFCHLPGWGAPSPWACGQPRASSEAGRPAGLLGTTCKKYRVSRPSLPLWHTCSRGRAGGPASWGGAWSKCRTSQEQRSPGLEGGAGREHMPAGSTWHLRVQGLPQA